MKPRAKHVACKQGERPMRVGLETDADVFPNENSQLKAEEGFRDLFLWGKAAEKGGRVSGSIGFGETSGALKPKCRPASGCGERSSSGADPGR